MLEQVIEIREIQEGELDRFVVAMRAALDEADTVEGYLDWKRQAQETTWLVATEGARDVGAAIGIGGWHSPDGIARGEVRVVGDARGRGVGSALLGELSGWARGLGSRELQGPVKEVDQASLDWTARRRLRRGRPQLAARPRPDGDRGPGRRRAGGDRGRHLGRATCPHRGDVRGGARGVSRRPRGGGRGGGAVRAVALDGHARCGRQAGGDVRRLAGGEVVAYAKLALSRARPHVAMHDMTGVRRAWRGRGIAGALKAAEIAWAMVNGYERLETQNEERNEPIRRLNKRHGYVVGPGSVTVRGPIA
jgi:GNAT superfamily N-acetyltransferase